MKFYYTNGACSIGIRIILEEIGCDFDHEHLDIIAGESRTPEFLAINPKGKIPTLVRDDGSALTEFPAIAFYLAWSYPESKLLPEGPEGQARALEMFEYLVSTVHMRGLHRMFGPHRIASGANEAEVYQDGLEIVSKAMALLDPILIERKYALGDFSIVDGPLFYVMMHAYRMDVDLPQSALRYLRDMLQRPSVQRTVAAENVGGWLEPLLQPAAT